ncbi:hypothetical protein N431DRAFT_448719 [Stipitochalara longipes BDJ]|nr:hypothetical protein N431DRAFT_448719 [Stipitochalara longipes BDJ]
MIKERNSKHALLWLAYTTMVAVILGIVSSNALLWYRFAHLEGHHTSSNMSTTLTCGNSAEEARRLGCELDVMVYSYTPPACLNKTHALEFFYSEDWPFWEDFNRTTSIPREDILTGKYEGFYSTWAFHGAHCQYLLTRNLQVLPTGGPLNDYMLDREHNTHCFEEVRKPGNLRRELQVGLTFSSCTLGNMVR